MFLDGYRKSRRVDRRVMGPPWDISRWTGVRRLVGVVVMSEGVEAAWLGGRYELGASLGYGGMAEVWAAIDHRLERAVAVKMLRPDLARQAAVRRRFETEARAAARLAHPNLVVVYDSGEEDG